MKSITLAALLVAAGAIVGATWAQVRPMWSYHNGNTLFAQTAEYRRGFAIGVIDGYLLAQQRRAESGDDGLWLDRCVTAGRTLTRVDAEIAAHFQAAQRHYKDPAAAIVLRGLAERC